jgi:hypothetical protein
MRVSPVERFIVPLSRNLRQKIRDGHRISRAERERETDRDSQRVREKGMAKEEVG